jgi:hypothetical protein
VSVTKLDYLCSLYNRPTVGQAIGECIKEYMRYAEKNNKVADIDYIVRTVKKELVKEKKDRNST